MTKTLPYFFDHSMVAFMLPFRLSSSRLPRNGETGGPGSFRSGDRNASKNRNLQMSQARKRVSTARITSLYSISSVPIFSRTMLWEFAGRLLPAKA